MDKIEKARQLATRFYSSNPDDPTAMRYLLWVMVYDSKRKSLVTRPVVQHSWVPIAQKLVDLDPLADDAIHLLVEHYQEQQGNSLKLIL